jgi:hypothetical protein
VHASGAVEVEHRARGFLLPMLRAGLRGGLCGELSLVEWYGRGPHESYCDRKTGQQLRVHRCAVAELEHLYMRPQENGNRTDVRSLSFTRGDGRGLRIDAETSLGFGAGYYSQEALDRAGHYYEMAADDFIHLTLDARQRGVGGDMPGAACLHAPYRMKPGKYAFRFTMRRAQ